MTIWLYTLRRFLVATLQVTVIVGLLIFVMTGVENIRSLSRYGASASDIVAITLLETPQVLMTAFPLILMLSSLTTFLRLSKSSELVIVRASGVSGITALHLPVIASILFGIFSVVAVAPVVQAADDRANDRKTEFRTAGRSVLSVSDREIWLRQGSDTGQTVIEADRVTANGAVLVGVRLHDYDTDGHLVARLEADSAALVSGAWLLRNVERWPLDTASVDALETPTKSVEYRLPTDLTRDQILDGFAPPEALPIWKVPEFIARLETAGFSALRHKLHLHSEIARPALFAAMVLIGAGFSMRHVRFGQTGVMILMAILVGFLLYFFKDFAESLGANGTVPVILSAWAPPMAAIMLATALLLHLEDG